MYRDMGHGLYEIMLASISDETHFIHNYNTEPIVKSTITSSDRGALEDGRYGHFNWANNYSRIRQTNIFLDKIDGTTFDAAVKQRLKGEVYFLRAYFYHNLMRMYGGVPLITKVYGLNDDFSVARNSFAETVAFIVADADSAAALLPASYSGADVGRATKGAALALKARVLLYAASDLYNVNPSGNAFTGYTPIQNLIDDYRKADGSKFDWNNPAEAAAPYANRDPRLSGSILYDGAPWRQRPDDVKKLDAVGVIQTFRQLRIIDTTLVNGQPPKIDTTMVPGLDTRDSPVE